ncbi:two pore domain potassium channel family protein [Lutibacter sp. HS1-25]|uniref:potassium channel family protein n=1 Tax=Lutibacter sp. HS1-25 TaxID=2485000 RepID=UPI001011C39A|nr:potassium channel family protein [Lutibacter sp. HS1-25]RXP64546.1 two pore domain potassium channel family protein [Lutibacter sp. HS1-25]
MWNNILIGLILIISTSFVHATTTKVVLSFIHQKHKFKGSFLRIIYINSIVLITIFATIIEGVIWAFTYLIIDAFKTFEEAFYFSLITYTTLGYGDIILSNADRLLGAFEAANGVIMLGWSTAIVVTAIQKIYT